MSAKALAIACVQAEYAKMEHEAARRGGALVHASQAAVASGIVAAFTERGANVVTLVAPPQWGKTGVILATIVGMCRAGAVHPDHVYVVSGMSDKDWRAQTKGRMLPSMRERVLHRNELKTLRTAVQGAADVLLVVDECHFASESTQTLYESLRDAGIWDVDVLGAANIRVLCVSATPGAMLLDAQTWGQRHETVVADVGLTPSYTSFRTLLNESRVHAFEMREPGDVERLCARILARWPDEPRWHIVRASNKEVARCGFVGVAERLGFAITQHNSARRIADIDRALTAAPAAHHFILIRGFWRAAATLDDRYIGVCYDKSKDYSTTAQGLGGRLCGHGRQRGDRAPVLLTNKAAVVEYVHWLESGCDYFACKRYNSASLTMVRGVVRKQKISTMHATCVENLDPVPVRGGAQTHVADAGAEADATGALWLTEAPQPLPEAPPIPARATTSAYRLEIQELLARHLGLRSVPHVQVAYGDKRAAKFNAAIYINNPQHYECDYWVGTAGDAVVYVALNRRALAAFRTTPEAVAHFHTFDGKVRIARKEA